jgi:lipopolysaccharide export system protein LptA
MCLVLAILISAASCSFDYRDSRLSDSLADQVPDNVLMNYEHTSIRRGEPAFKVSASSSKIYKSKHRAELEDVRFEEFDDGGEIVARGEAQHATVFTQSDNVELSGSVRFSHIPEDFDIEAPYLYWNNQERSLSGEESDTVHIERLGGSSISGKGFSSSGIYRSIQFSGSVEGVYRKSKEEQEEEDSAGTASEESDDGNRFTFSGDSTSIQMSEGDRRTVLTGDARIVSDKVSIRADSIELYGEDFRFARCSGNVETEVKEKELHLSSRSLFYDREKDILRIEGYNEMVDYRNELVAKSGYLEHRGEEQETIFQIGVRILKATDDTRMVCRGEFARYDRENSLLTLSGMPLVQWKDDTYRATRIIINLDSDEIRLEGDVEGTVTTSGEEEEEEEAADE